MEIKQIEVKRDGLTLRGDIRVPDGADKCPAVIIFHGFMASRGYGEPNGMFERIADACAAAGMAAVKFDFDGHGESGGEFSDMNVYSEILDAAKIIDYVRKLPFVTDIYIVGHSQGSVVGGMIAGLYREYVSKLVMLAPAATLKDDALAGSLFGTSYDSYDLLEYIPVTNDKGQQFKTGNLYFRIAKTLPIYETTAMFPGKTLIIHGSEDQAVGVIGARRYKERMPRAELIIVDGADHGFTNFTDFIVEKTAKFLADN